jgi:hypothetical protein
MAENLNHRRADRLPLRGLLSQLLVSGFSQLLVSG